MLMLTLAPDVRFWSIGTMAGKILCSKVGRDPPRTNTFSTPHQPTTGLMGPGTLQSCRVIDLQSQTVATRETNMKSKVTRLTAQREERENCIVDLIYQTFLYLQHVYRMTGITRPVHVFDGYTRDSSHRWGITTLIWIFVWL